MGRKKGFALERERRVFIEMKFAEGATMRRFFWLSRLFKASCQSGM